MKSKKEQAFKLKLNPSQRNSNVKIRLVDRLSKSMVIVFIQKRIYPAPDLTCFRMIDCSVNIIT